MRQGRGRGGGREWECRGPRGVRRWREKGRITVKKRWKNRTMGV